MVSEVSVNKNSTSISSWHIFGRKLAKTDIQKLKSEMWTK